MEATLEVGGLCLFKKFIVKDYKQNDKFICVMNYNFIIFNNESKVCDLDEKDICIESAVYDFLGI